MVNNFSNTIENLKVQLQNELPGNTVHAKLLPPGRVQHIPSKNHFVVQSSVILLLFPDDKNIKIVVIHRPKTMKNHAGQIAFPGGKVEPEDSGFIATALRETYEEIGVPPSEIEILGILTPIFVQVSNFVINPVVGWCKSKPNFTLDCSEIENLYAFNIEELKSADCIHSRNMETISGMLEVPGFSIDGLFIWGATAMILSEFIEVYRKITLEKSPCIDSSGQ